MGLKIHTLAEIPDSVSKNYYLYILDYYNWDEPIGSGKSSVRCPLKPSDSIPLCPNNPAH